MGITGHMALAFVTEDESRIISLLTEKDSPENGDCIKYQPNFHLIREDCWEIHQVLLTISEIDSRFLPISSTVIIGKKLVAQIAHGSQYLFSCDDVTEIAQAFSHIDKHYISSAIKSTKFQRNFSNNEKEVQDIITKILIMRKEFQKLSKNRWALIAGMY